MIKLKKRKSIVVILTLVFGSAFVLMVSGLLGLLSLQLKEASQKVSWYESLEIAEAGVNYYRWCLNNGIEDQCLGDKDFYDVEGELLGTFSITATSTESCGQTIKRNVVSTGRTDDFPNLERQISVLYGRASVAKYAYLINDNVWAGSDREIRGLYHSNGGIRMDGENQSLVTSGEEEWVCTSSFGCGTCPTSDGCYSSGGSCYCPGVFTTTDNSNDNLFSYPDDYFDFAGITMDLAEIKSAAQTYAGGVYLPPSTDINSNAEGYHVVFQNDGTFDVYIITDLDRYYGYNSEEGWHYDYFGIDDEYLYNSYPIEESCSLVFLEDNVWLEGEVNGKATLASANIINPNEDTDIVLYNDINYVDLDGSDGLLALGENNVLISPTAPDIMELRGIFLAQKGRFGINHYSWNIKDNLEIYGSVVSNGRVGTQWTSGSSIVSGFSNRESYFDTNMVYSPPPFVPYSEHDFRIINWQEL
jgi:Tfp pilus assembly protein PilV